MGDTTVDRAEAVGDLLLVEDNALHVRLVRSMLEEVWYGLGHISHVTRLSDALAHLAEHTPIAVLLDLNLPDAEDLDGLDRMLAAAPDVPIVVLSAQADESTALGAIRRGAQDYLVKGEVDAPGLTRAVRFAVRRASAARPAEETSEPGFAVFDIEGRVLRADERFAAVCGRGLDAVVFGDSSLWFRGEDHEVWRRLLKAVEQQPETAKAGHFTFVGFDGTRVPATVSVTLLRDQYAGPAGFVTRVVPDHAIEVPPPDRD